MNYNFDEIIERRGTGCVKWDEKPPTLPTLNAERSTKEILPLWVADMDFAVAPAIQEAVKRRAEHPIFGYTHVQEDYYAAVINWFRSRHSWHIKREWMLYTTGVVPAITVTLKALTTPGENVLILSPDYNCFYSSIHNSGCQVAESVLRLDPDQQERFSVDWQDFETLCADEKTTVFLLCNPHNPTGRVWTEEELQQMADICHRHHVSIVSDEIHCELIMPGNTFVPMGTVDDTAVILNSPSKAFNIAGLQMANIICKDADTRRRINRYINIHEVCDVNPFAPEAVKAAYNESGEWLDAMNGYVWENYKALVLFCNEHMPHWHVMPMEGTYLVWVDVSACCDSVATYCEQLIDKAKVWLNPGTMYGPISGEGYLRINIACPRSLLMEALERVRKLTKK